MIYLLIGQPGSGKTTLGKILSKNFDDAIHIDGDENREREKNFDYTKIGREKNLNNIIDRCIDNKDKNVIVSIVCPYKNIRDKFFEKLNVFGVYLYTNEIRGKEHYHCKNFDIPSKRFMKINTDNSVDYCINKILQNI